jgi:hypothetical protein
LGGVGYMPVFGCEGALVVVAGAGARGGVHVKAFYDEEGIQFK